MKPFKKLYNFLGSVYFAIILITLVAIIVAAGTFLEAITGSHLFSASFTYSHPFFLALIWGFFINILFSALRRWPFKVKHIPFLTTHLGLLLLLGGVIVKGYYGVQGNMSLMEGGSTNRIFIPNTFVVHIEKKDAHNPYQKIELDYPLNKIAKQTVKFDDVEMRLADYAQHSHERFQTWIKDDKVVLSGVGTIPVTDYENRDLAQPFKARFDSSVDWKVLAYRTKNVSNVAKELYETNGTIKIFDRDGVLLKELNLVDALKEPVVIEGIPIKFSLDWTFDNLSDQLEAYLLVADKANKIPLVGPDSLLNKISVKNGAKEIFLTIDLIKDPTIVILQDEKKDDYLFSYNAHGEIHSKSFRHDSLQSVIVYDNGFGGYAAQMSFPFGNFPSGRHEKEQAERLGIAVQIRNSLDKKIALSPPLAMLKKASVKAQEDFATIFLNFLYNWDNNSSLLYSNALPKEFFNTFQHLNWNTVALKDQYACSWLCMLLEEMEMQIKNGKSFYEILNERNWPFIANFTGEATEDKEQMIILFAQQLFAAADHLPKPDIMPNEMSAKALSAYMLALGITPSGIRQPLDSHENIRLYHSVLLFNHEIRKILQPLELQSNHMIGTIIENMADDSKVLSKIKEAFIIFQKQSRRSTTINYSPTVKELANAVRLYQPLEEKTLSEIEYRSLISAINDRDILLETPLTLNQSKAPSLQKWEDNHPLITLEFTKNNKKEYFTLTYDKYGTALNWPILDGSYTIRYQPLFIEIPYKIRLHEGRQINYPGSQQAYSYESEIIIRDLKNNERIEKNISMNNVHETNDGYRFYLSNLTPSDESAPKRVQIIVNHDPAKYYMTYPGALIMCLGIILLFWMRPYSKK